MWRLSGPRTVIVFFVVAIICHIALSYTRYGKFTYAIGANPQAARVSGIDIGKHLVKVYAVAGLLSGLQRHVGGTRPIWPTDMAFHSNLMRLPQQSSEAHPFQAASAV